jgi:hypothetical protein
VGQGFCIFLDIKAAFLKKMAISTASVIIAHSQVLAQFSAQ